MLQSVAWKVVMTVVMTVALMVALLAKQWADNSVLMMVCMLVEQKVV